MTVIYGLRDSRFVCLFAELNLTVNESIARYATIAHVHLTTRVPLSNARIWLMMHNHCLTTYSIPKQSTCIETCAEVCSCR